jgi:hypothetical protein
LKKIILIALIGTMFLLSGCTEATTGEAFRVSQPRTFISAPSAECKIFYYDGTVEMTAEAFCINKKSYATAGAVLTKDVVTYYESDTNCTGMKELEVVGRMDNITPTQITRVFPTKTSPCSNSSTMFGMDRRATQQSYVLCCNPF